MDNDARQHLSTRRTALAGGVFVCVDLIALLLGGPLPSIDDSATRITAFYVDAAPRLLAQAYVRGLSMAAFLWFAVALAGVLGRRGRSAHGRVVVGGVVAAAAVELVRVAVVAAVALQPERVGGETLVAFHALGVILGAVIAFPIAAAQVSLTLLIAPTTLPRWLVGLGPILAVAWLATGVRAVASAHWLWTSGTVVTILWGLWLVSLCIALARTRTEDL